MAPEWTGPRSRNKLTRELTGVLVIKFILLAVIWTLFVREQRVPVDETRMAAALRLNDSRPAHQEEGLHHGH